MPITYKHIARVKPGTEEKKGGHVVLPPFFIPGPCKGMFGKAGLQYPYYLAVPILKPV